MYHTVYETRHMSEDDDLYESLRQELRRGSLGLAVLARLGFGKP